MLSRIVASTLELTIMAPEKMGVDKRRMGGVVDLVGRWELGEEQQS